MPRKNQAVSDQQKARQTIAMCKRNNRPVDIIQRFWSYIDVKGKDECWEWKGGLSAKGYGSFRVGKKCVQTHRFVYELTHGEIKSGKLICHTCHNRKCCNPSHVYEGTAKTNSDDMVRANRDIRLHGESHGMARLTESQVKDIKQNNIPTREIANNSGLTYQAIWSIRHNRTWKHV